MSTPDGIICGCNLTSEMHSPLTDEFDSPLTDEFDIDLLQDP